MKLTLVISLLIINGCTPLFNAGGLMHSVVTNNTVSTILGLGDTASKENVPYLCARPAHMVFCR